MSMAPGDEARPSTPRRSRLAADVRAALDDVAAASDWLDGYQRISRRYDGKATHCQVYQEVGTLINTLRFAESVGDGICKQVAQGSDTDSFGCTAGAILGAFFGPGHLAGRWLEPFGDEIRTGLAFFHERSLSKVADRVAALPALTAQAAETAESKRAAGPGGKSTDADV